MARAPVLEVRRRPLVHDSTWPIHGPCTTHRGSSESVWEPIPATGRHSGSRSPIHSDHPSIAITRAYQRARNNWDFDPQGIERSSDAGGMDSFDTCNPSFHLNHVWGFQLRRIA